MAALISERIGADPFGNTVFVFEAERNNLIRLNIIAVRISS